MKRRLPWVGFALFVLSGAVAALVGCHSSASATDGPSTRETVPASGDRPTALETAPGPNTEAGPLMGPALLHTDFLLPGRTLRIGYPEKLIGLPVIAFERLYLQQGPDISQIHTPDDLVGHVRIADPEMALQYVRLYTSPAVVRVLDQPWWLEIAPVSAVDDAFVFGRDEYVKRLQSVETGRGYKVFAILSDDDWKQSGLTPPVALPDGDGFCVTRWLCSVSEAQEFQTSTIQQVAETVGPAGSLHREVLDKRTLPGLVMVILREE